MPPKKQETPDSRLLRRIKKSFPSPPGPSPLEAIAAETGLSRQIINSWLLGRCRPGFDQIKKLADALEITVGVAHKMIAEIPINRSERNPSARN